MRPRLRNVVATVALSKGSAAAALAQPKLVPAYGADLAPTDAGRVRAGMLAPDFTLEALKGPAVASWPPLGSRS